MSRNVRFRESSPGGSRGHRRSDSGVAEELAAQRFDVHALQEALADSVSKTDHWKHKAHQVDAELTQTRKELRESEAQRRAEKRHNETVESDLKQFEAEHKQFRKDRRELEARVKQLERDNQSLLGENDALRRRVEELESRGDRSPRNKPPVVMTSAIPAEKPHRSPSKRENDAAEKIRLSKRFGGGEGDSDSSGGAAKPHPRRPSYVEPWGPPAPSSNRHYEYVTTTPQYTTPVTSSPHKTTFSTVPRTTGVAQMQRPYVEQPAYPYGPPEDGNYHVHPLPEKQRKGERKGVR